MAGKELEECCAVDNNRRKGLLPSGIVPEKASPKRSDCTPNAKYAQP